MTSIVTLWRNKGVIARYRNLSVVLFLIFFCTHICYATSSTANVAIRVVAHTKATGYSDPTARKFRVDLWIDLTNSTAQPIRLPAEEAAGSGVPFGERDYYIAVSRQDGISVNSCNKNAPYIDREMKYPGVYHLQVINPGQKITEFADAAALYDMSKPGVYLIHVERKMPPELGGNFVSSNEITVKIPD